MRATICVQGNRPETYSNVMAAVMVAHPDTTQFDFLILNDQDGEALLRAVEADLSTQTNHDAYVQASRRWRTERKEILLGRRTFRDSRLIDVTGISKELTADILAIAITTGKPVCSLSWKERIGVNRKLVGSDPYEYFDAMKSGVVRDIYRAQKAVWLMFYILSGILISFAFVFGASWFGIDLLPTKAISFLGLLTAIGGLFLSYVALTLTPIQPGVDK